MATPNLDYANAAAVEAALDKALTSAQVSLIRQQDFTENTTYLASRFTPTLTHDLANSRVLVETTTLDHGVIIYGGITLNDWVVVEIDVTLLGGKLRFVSAWSGYGLDQQTAVINQSGTHRFAYQALNGEIPEILNGVDGANSWYIDGFRIYRLNEELVKAIKANTAAYFSADLLNIGKENVITTDYNTYTITIGKGCTNPRGLVIGENATATNGAAGVGRVSSEPSVDLVIGQYATAVVNTEFSPNATGGPKTVIGNNAEAHSWRALAIGSDAIAAATSSTAIGTGAYAAAPHSIALGRGATVPFSDWNNVVAIGAISGTDLYLFQSFAHEHAMPPTGIAVGSCTPSATYVKIHGQDAFDQRETPLDFNVDGGHLRLVSGRSTGTGLGGTVEIATSPAQGGTGENVKNPEVVAAKFDSTVAPTGDNPTRFLLLDTATGTFRRIEFGSVDSGGSGYRALVTPN